VFTHASHLVSSLVVVPLLVDDRPLGALYFTQDTPCDFSNIQDALLVRALQRLRERRLHGPPTTYGRAPRPPQSLGPLNVSKP
jgi:hypothetical protein